MTALRRRSAIWAFAFTALALGSCNDDTVIRKLPEPAVQVDVLKQKPAALVDILWVVDNSGSMAEEQAAVASGFDKFITGLTLCHGTGMENDICDFTTKKCKLSAAPCNPPDYHIGVVTTDTFSAVDSGRLRKVGLCTTAPNAAPANSKFRYCQGDDRQCAVDAMDPASDPANNKCDMSKAISFVTPTTDGAINAFQRLVKVGTNGAGMEDGIRAAAMALGRDADRSTGMFKPVPPENAMFLRNEATLFVIFVSDENDNSFGEVTYYYRAFDSLKGAGNEDLVSMSAIVGDPDPDGEMGMLPGGCPKPPATQTANPGTRYIALGMYTRGQTAEFRSCDDKRLKCPTSQTCQKPVPDLPGICVNSASCQKDEDCGNFKCGAVGCITCDNAKCNVKADGFIQLLGRNGIFGQICATDYGAVLGPLGFEAAGLRRKFPMTKFPDCSQEKVDCAGMKDAYLCVKVNGQVIPNDRATGWTYEPGSNAVFFDGNFVPPTDAPIEISYRVSQAMMQISCEMLVK